MYDKTVNFIKTNTPRGVPTEETVEVYTIGSGSPHNKVKDYAPVGGLPRNDVYDYTPR